MLTHEQTLDKEAYIRLYEESSHVDIDESIIQSITPSTLGLKALRYLIKIIDHVRPQNVLEFGSGLSTQLMASLFVEQDNTHLYSIDHSKHYLDKTRQRLHQYPNTHLIHAPITRYYFQGRYFASYDPAWTNQIPAGVKFDLVIIDGPPGFSFGREAPLYQAQPFLHSNSVILLDDSNRPPEQEALSHWVKVWGRALTSLHFPDLDKGLSILMLDEPRQMNNNPFELKDRWVSRYRSWRTLKNNND